MSLESSFLLATNKEKVLTNKAKIERLKKKYNKIVKRKNQIRYTEERIELEAEQKTIFDENENGKERWARESFHSQL